MTNEQIDQLFNQKPYFPVGSYKLELFRADDTKIKSIPWPDNKIEAQKFVAQLVSDGICDHAKLSMVVWDSKLTPWNVIT